MGDDKEFQERVHKIGGLVQQLEDIADPVVRSRVKELVQLLMDMHCTGLERMLEIIFQAGDHGARIIDELGRDSLVSSLLVLYGLHPEDLQTRVERKLDEIRPKLRKVGAEVHLITAADGVIHLQVTLQGHVCGSTTKTLQAAIEEAIYEAAPDLKSLTIEGLESSAASGFIAMESLLSTVPHTHGEGMD
jgi:Fe-S cluster biogenesis protein NfuA